MWEPATAPRASLGAAPLFGAASPASAPAPAAAPGKYVPNIEKDKFTVLDGDYYIAYKPFCRVHCAVGHTTMECPSRRGALPPPPPPSAWAGPAPGGPSYGAPGSSWASPSPGHFPPFPPAPPGAGSKRGRDAY